MAIVKIYGASDDLIEIEGDISDEINCYNEENGIALAFSDGTALRVIYDTDGIWRITRIAEGTAKFSKVDGDVIKDTNDIVTLEGNILWIVVGTQFIK